MQAKEADGAEEGRMERVVLLSKKATLRRAEEEAKKRKKRKKGKKGKKERKKTNK